MDKESLINAMEEYADGVCAEVDGRYRTEIVMLKAENRELRERQQRLIHKIEDLAMLSDHRDLELDSIRDIVPNYRSPFIRSNT